MILVSLFIYFLGKKNQSCCFFLFVGVLAVSTMCSYLNDIQTILNPTMYLCLMTIS
ncbi:unnamed protein product [Brassica napus]|uniref:(rape) hypothetical protein n=1 Tax=Brassica napus TaxID=3708 RepID=A0A816MUT6_BRANA|nr:unnamed protein product [Brassica napus]